MGSALAKQLRSPSENSCMGWVAQKVMAMGNGSDSIDAVSLMKETVATNATIVELGPGAGYALRKILSDLQPSRVYGIEISDAFRNALASDKDLAASLQNGKLSLHDDDAKKLDFIPDNSVDFIFGFNVIYFLDPLEEYVKELYRILKPGGHVHFGVKAVAKNFDPSVYVNTDWDDCLTQMQSVGFVYAKQGEERMEGPLAYTPLMATKAPSSS